MSTRPNLTKAPRLAGEPREDARPAAGALVEGFEVVFLVGRVHAVVVEREADEQRVHAEHFPELADDRDRPARADRHRLLAPFRRECRAGLAQHRIVIGELDRRRDGVIEELDGAIDRQALAHERAERARDLFRILLAHQTERYLGPGRGRNYRLGALAGIAADDAVDVAGRAGGDLLDQHAILLAGRSFQADLAQKILRGEIEREKLRTDVGRQLARAVVEARNGDAP